MNRQKWKIPLSHKLALKNTLKTAFPGARLESEQYCDYRMRITTSQKQNIIAKQYDNGTFYAEGPDATEWNKLCELVNASSSTIAPIKSAASIVPAVNSNVPFLHDYIGQDESGKGDYFGGPVVAGVCLTVAQAQALKKAGVQDSKNLGPLQITAAAKNIMAMIPPEAIEIIDTPPGAYNALYETYKSQGKNLNNLLGHLHATILTRLAGRFPGCQHAVIDQFGKPTDVTSYLSLPKTFTVIQQPKAESFIAVAAASILARHAFVQQIKTLEDKYQYRFPLGAGSDVIIAARNFINRYGKNELHNVAKLHFKTTDSL